MSIISTKNLIWLNAVITAFLISSVAFAGEKKVAEENDSPQVEKVDKVKQAESPWFADTGERLTVAPFFDIPGIQLTMRHSQADKALDEKGDYQLTWSHKLIQTFGVSVNYGNLGLAGKYQPAYNRNASPGQGKTVHRDLRTNYTLPNMTFDLYFQSYKGFYVSSVRKDGDWQTVKPDSKIQPGLQALNRGFSTTYVFRGERFSPRAALDFSKRQLRFGHSPLASVAFMSSLISDSDGLIPADYRSEFGDYGEISRLDLKSLTLGGGYGVTGVIRGFVLHAAAQVGLGSTLGTYELENKSLEKTMYTGLIDLRLAAGYNTANYFAGLNYILHGINSQIDTGLSVSRTVYSATLVGGFRK